MAFWKEVMGADVIELPHGLWTHRFGDQLVTVQAEFVRANDSIEALVPRLAEPLGSVPAPPAIAHGTEDVEHELLEEGRRLLADSI